MPNDTNPHKAPYEREVFTSYSLNFEDVILHRLLAGCKSGFYVDVGAGHPRLDNDTFALYEAGWRGINVEPNQTFFDALQEIRPDDRNLCIALCDQAEGTLIYHEVTGTGLSTCDIAQAQPLMSRGYEVRSREVPVSTLARVLNEAGAPTLDLLKVDVEGLEEVVLVGNDWTRYRPRAVLVEATFPETSKRRPTGIRTFMEAHGYRLAYFDGLNDFYLERDFNPPDVFALPPNVFDGFVPREIVDLREEIVDLRAAAAFAHEQLCLAQSHAVSLEAARKAQEPESADVYAASRRRRAALETVLKRLLRGEHLSSLKLLTSDGSLNLPDWHDGGIPLEEIDDASGRETEASDPHMLALANRLAAAQLEGLKAENHRLSLDLEEVRAEEVRLISATGQMRGEILTLNRALEPMHRLNEMLERWHIESRAHQARAEQFSQQVRAHQAHAEQLSQQVQAIYASSSWRFTRPWRALGRVLRGQRGSG
jgi:FkbM family methyltransferase